jgi:hypothetical protein
VKRRILNGRLRLAPLILMAVGAVGAAQPGEFLLKLEDTEAVRKVWGDVRSFAEPRTAWGRDESHPAHRRGAAVGAGSNAIFEVGPFVFPAGLRVNVDALHGESAMTQQSYVMVEAVDAQGNVIEAFSRERCLWVNVNDLARPLTWTGTTVSALVGAEVTLRFHTRGARIYSLHNVPLPGAVAPTSLHDALPPDAPEELTLTLEAAQLVAWETTRFSLSGRTARGRALNLDQAEIEFLVEGERGPLQVQSDKFDRQTGHATLAGDVSDPRRVTIRAQARVGTHTISSEPVALRLEPGASAQERRIVQLFLQPSDLSDRQGEVLFEANTVRPYARTRGLPTTPKAMTLFGHRIDDRYHVWGSSREYGGLYRAETADGITYENLRPLKSPMAPEHLLSMTYNERDGVYLALERAFGPSRFKALASRDGIRFDPVADRPAFVDHDGAHVWWDGQHGRYLVMGLTFQKTPEPRPFIDNLVWQDPFRAEGFGLRRVFTIRQSRDGISWTPSQSVTQRDPATWLPDEQLILPDAQDPVDLEYYWFLAFRHHDRWMGIVLTYAPSPFNVLERVPYDPYPSKHGPHLGTEWWVSNDGVKWERPWRGTPATLDWRIYFGHEPMRLHDRMLFLTSNQLYNLPPAHGARSGQHQEVYSLPADRIASAGSDSPAVFTSRAFAMPASGLFLNYEHAGTLAVELLDEQGRVLPGYGRSDGFLPAGSAIAAPLRWSGQPGGDLAGRTVHLRFHSEKSRVYALYRD